MSFYSLLRILQARWLLTFATLAFCIGMTLAISLLLPKTYTAVTELIVDDKPQDLISGQLLPGREGYSATQVDVVTSRNVASRVYELLSPAQQALVQQQIPADTVDVIDPELWLTGFLLENLEATAGGKSSVLKISVSNEDPELAAALANMAAEAYIRASLELRTDPARRFSEWYEQQLDVLRENLRNARSGLSKYQREHGIVAVDERLDVENSRLRELSSLLVAAQGQRLSDESRQFKSRDEAWRRSSTDVVDNPVVQQLRAELAKAEAKRSELATRLGSNHPEFVQANAEVLMLRSRIAQQTAVVGESIRSAAELSLSREEDLAQALAVQKNRVLELISQRDELEFLQQEVRMAQETYNTAASRTSASRLESRLAETDIAVLNPAVTPSQPSAPDIRLNLVLASMLGLFLGIGLSLLMELARRRVRSRADLEDSLGLPVLAYIPKERRRWFRREGALA